MADGTCGSAVTITEKRLIRSAVVSECTSHLHRQDTHLDFKGGDHSDGRSTVPCLKPEIVQNKDPEIK